MKEAGMEAIPFGGSCTPVVCADDGRHHTKLLLTWSSECPREMPWSPLATACPQELGLLFC